MYSTLLLLTSALAVPLDCAFMSQCSSGALGAPVIRTFERQGEDDYRRANWDRFCKELDRAWAEYRNAGSTAEAFARYKKKSGVIRYEYLNRDAYLVPFVR